MFAPFAFVFTINAPLNVFVERSAPSYEHFLRSSTLSLTAFACPIVFPTNARSHLFGSVSIGGNRISAIAGLAVASVTASAATTHASAAPRASPVPRASVTAVFFATRPSRLFATRAEINVFVTAVDMASRDLARGPSVRPRRPTVVVCRAEDVIASASASLATVYTHEHTL
jgi:hypothetical protein